MYIVEHGCDIHSEEKLQYANKSDIGVGNFLLLSK